MPLQIVENDITEMRVDAIVNAANNSLLGGGGVDGCIHRAAGKGLLAECRKLGGCETGKVKVTAGYDLPCKYVIHAVGPRWFGGKEGEPALLRSCYLNALEAARERGCESIAFPLISSGIFGCPKQIALRIAVDAIRDFLAENEMLVCLVIYNRAEFPLEDGLRRDIAKYINDSFLTDTTDTEELSACAPTGAAPGRFAYEDEARFVRGGKTRRRLPRLKSKASLRGAERFASIDAESAPDEAAEEKSAMFPPMFDYAPAISLEEALKQIDESFSEMLLRKIDESGMTDAECYKKANVDRKLFSKIRSDRLYKPSKTTAVAFALALELPIAEVREMLMKAGFALSRSNKFDIIVEYFINHGNYNIYEINEALFAFDQKLIGA